MTSLDRICISRICCAMLLCTVITGCGYTTKRPFRDDIQTVFVEMLHSREFRRELEFSLSEAIVKRIELDTPYKIAPRSRADSVLSGEILEVRQATLGTDFDTDLPRETAATIVMSWRWKDLRTGEMLRQRPRAIYTTTYIPPVGETFQTGMLRGLDGLAEQVVVEVMESGW